LASSRLSLSGPDVIDVAVVVEAFETINKVDITICGKVEPVDGHPCLTFLVGAQQKSENQMERVYLGSVKCHLGWKAHQTVESAIMWALYQLDWQLAEEEMRKANKTA